MPKVSRIVCGVSHLLYVSGERKNLHVAAWGRGAIEISSSKKSSSSSSNGRILNVTRQHRPLALNKNDEAFSAHHIACGDDFVLCTVIPCGDADDKVVVKSNKTTKKELARTLTKEEAAELRRMKKTKDLSSLKDSFLRMTESFSQTILDRTNLVVSRVSDQARMIRLVSSRLREDRENDDVVVELREENNRLREDIRTSEKKYLDATQKLQEENHQHQKQNEKLNEENARLREQIARFERLQRENVKEREETDQKHALVKQQLDEMETYTDELKQQLCETEEHAEELKQQLDDTMKEADRHHTYLQKMECEVAAYVVRVFFVHFIPSLFFFFFSLLSFFFVFLSNLFPFSTTLTQCLTGTNKNHPEILPHEILFYLWNHSTNVVDLLYSDSHKHWRNNKKLKRRRFIVFKKI